MKTLFISSFHPLISRNILRAGILEKLSGDFRIVILVPDIKTDYFKEEFNSKDIFVEGIDMRLYWADLFFRKLALMLSGTQAVYIKRRSQYFQDKKLTGILFFTIFSRILGGSKIFLKIVRFIDLNFFRSRRFKALFDKYMPDLVFSTDLQNELDVGLLKEAKAFGVKNIGMVRSWDNLTSKGIIRILPDKILVHNEIIRKEAAKYDYISEQAVSAIGVPHYDKYFADSFKTRSEFIVRFGLDLSKKTILFSPIGDRYIRGNELDCAVLETLSGLDANILVRLPPTDSVNFQKFKGRGAKVVFQDTGAKMKKGGKKLNEISKDDDESLALSLNFCDLVVTGQSTIAVDAAVFNKPVVVIGFDSDPRVYWDSVKRYYDYEYYLPVIKSGGVKMAESPEKLTELVKNYLENPHLDEDGRKIILKEQAQFADGKSTERLEKELRDYL